MQEAVEYNNSESTAEKGQKYLEAHPEMWSYFDDKESGMMNAPDIDLMPPVDNSYGSGLVVGAYPMGSGYEYPSQPELTEDVKYPVYHTVRKHGGSSNQRQQQFSSGSSSIQQQEQLSGPGIIVNRRGDDSWENDMPGGLPAPGLSYPPMSYGNNMLAQQSQVDLRTGRGRYRYVPPQSQQVPLSMPRTQWAHKSTNYGTARGHRVKKGLGTLNGVQRLVSTGKTLDVCKAFNGDELITITV